MEIVEKRALVSCQKGRLEEFDWLYRKYIKKIYNFIYYKVMNKEIAEDLTSQTFLKALDKIQTFDCEKGSFASWLYQIARNSVVDYYRQNKTESNIEDFWDLADNSSYGLDIDNRDLIVKVKKHLNKLRSDHREIIFMRLWDGMSYKEIARATGKIEGNCKMIFSRSIRDVRKLIPVLMFVFYLIKNL